jgi:hypothetical protein
VGIDGRDAAQAALQADERKRAGGDELEAVVELRDRTPEHEQRERAPLRRAQPHAKRARREERGEQNLNVDHRAERGRRDEREVDKLEQVERSV